MQKYSFKLICNKDDKRYAMVVFLKDCKDIDEAIKISNFEGDRLFGANSYSQEIFEYIPQPMEDYVKALEKSCRKKK